MIMKKKINVAELLKDCPKGMELDCLMFDNVTFVRVDMNKRQFPIEIAVSGVRSKYLSKEGCFHDTTLSPESKCVIFPKGKTTWDGFVPPCPFKDGDILYAIDEGNEYIFIFKEVYENERVYCHLNLKGGNLRTQEVWITDYNPTTHRLATEEEKQKLFDAIKDHGYKWNAKTKTLEMLTELTESKEEVDDRIVMSGIYFDRENYADEVELHLNNYEIEIRDGKTYAIFKNQETKTLKPKFKVGDRVVKKNGISVPVLITCVGNDHYYSNTENSVGYFSIQEQDDWELFELKFKVGDRIKYKNGKDIHGAEQGVILSITDGTYDVAVTNNMGIFVPIAEQDDWELVPNKFDITTLKPFDKVLVRSGNYQIWTANMFSSYCRENIHPFSCVSGYVSQCIPYEDNKHLLGTTDDCDEFYKTWE